MKMKVADYVRIANRGDKNSEMHARVCKIGGKKIPP